MPKDLFKSEDFCDISLHASFLTERAYQTHLQA